MRSVIRMLPDGSGRVRIHFFVHDDKGLIATPPHISMTPLGFLKLPGSGSRGYIACQPKLTTVNPVIKGGQSFPWVHSNDVRAVTCPECQATDAYKAIVKMLADELESSDPESAIQLMAGRVPT